MDGISLLPNFPRRTAFQAESRGASSSSLLVSPAQSHVTLLPNVTCFPRQDAQSSEWRTSSRRQFPNRAAQPEQPRGIVQSADLPLKKSRLGLVSQRRHFRTGHRPRRGQQPHNEVEGDAEQFEQSRAAVTRTPPRAVRGTAEDSGVEEGPNQEEEEEDCCPICLEPLPATPATVSLPCEHRLHDACLQLLLGRGFAHCPLCKRNVSTASPIKAGGRTLPPALLPSESGDEGPSEEDAEDGFCEVCGGGHQPDELLLCDRCDRGYHIFCLVPALSRIPEGSWYCPRCARARARLERRRMAAVPVRLTVADSDSDTPVVVRRSRSARLICDDDSD
eukprot:EG_transcript_12055